MKSFEQLKFEVKERVDFVELASRYTPLKKSTRGHTGLCPFPGHKEKTPSFHVSVDHCWCFGCNRGGDVFNFLEIVEGLSFKEALQELSIQLGLGWDWKQDSGAAAQSESFSAGLELLERATKYFSNCLWESSSAESRACKEYLLNDRRLSELEVKALRLGFAPASGLAKKIQTQDEKSKALDVGLLKRLEDGRVVDFFRHRLMIPIADSKGKILGFSGRVLPTSEHPLPKYMNSPETEWFKKKKIVYGLDRSMSLVRELGFVALVEGFFDQWAFERHGIPAVAVMGTALSEDHLARLERYTKQMVLVLDADQAGVAAMRKNLPILLDRSWDVKVFDDLDGKDPDEWLAGSGLSQADLKQRLLRASDGVEWLCRQLMLESGLKSWNRNQLLESVRTQVWPLVRSEIQKALVVDVLMPACGALPREEIRRALGQPGPSKNEPKVDVAAPQMARPSPRGSLSPQDVRAKDLLCWMLWNWDALRPWEPEERELVLRELEKTRVTEVVSRLLEPKLLSQDWQDARGILAGWAEGLQDSTLKSWIFMGLVSPQALDPQQSERVRPTLIQLRSALRRSTLEAEAAKLRALIPKNQADETETARLLQRIQEIQRDLGKSN